MRDGVVARRFEVTSEDAAAAVGVHPETIRRWARARRLIGRKTISGHWVFDRADVDALAVRFVVEDSDELNRAS